MRLLEFRNAIVAKLQAALVTPEATVAQVVPLDGRPSEADVQRHPVKVPVIFVSLTGGDPVKEAGNDLSAPVKVLLVIGTRDVKGATRSEVALDFVATVLGVVSGADFGLDFVQGAPAPRWESLYSKELAQQGWSLHAVTWTQLVDLEPLTDEAALNAFVTLAQTWSLEESAQASDAQDTITLEQP